MCSLLSVCTTGMFAQDSYSKVTSDFESWHSVRLKAKFNKKFTASLEQGMRLSENSTTLDQALTEIGISYKLTKGLEVGMGTRYIYDRTKNDNYENKFRYNLDASYKQEVNRLDLQLRLRFQNKKELDWENVDLDDPSSYFRIKFQTNYNIKNWKLDPEISAEIFRNLESNGGFDKIRYTIATKYSFKNAGDIGVFYRMENELNTSLPKTTYIAGLKYTYTIKPYK